MYIYFNEHDSFSHEDKFVCFYMLITFVTKIEIKAPTNLDVLYVLYFR